MEMSVVVFGAGIGAILLTVLWTIALLFCCISLRTKYNVGPITITIAIFVTVILLSIPRKSDLPPATAEKILDPLFVWRTSAVLFLGLCAVSSFTFVFMNNLMETKQARSIRS